MNKLFEGKLDRIRNTTGGQGWNLLRLCGWHADDPLKARTDRRHSMQPDESIRDLTGQQ